ncbi:pathogenicity-like protein [Pseudoxanthomonas putridarboris]|uniref:Pathogenicity-like protein n=1 Tax=Pseudoxanthomonas putridarboris TaxID=752605 RepID=A0ABU9J1Z7_9GAMM
MRQVFTSQRIETVEGVARLLTDAGIEVYISNGRSYHSKRGSQFSYTQPTPQSQQPALWIRHAEDQPRARELLRAAGLLETTRPGNGPSLTFTRPVEEAPRRSWAWRIRLILLALIALAAAVMWMRRPVPAPPVPAQPQEQPQPAPTEPAPADDENRVRIQPATG